MLLKMFQEPKIQPLLADESYTLHGQEAQHFFGDKVYTAARRGDKFRELIQDVFENVRSTIPRKPELLTHLSAAKTVAIGGLPVQCLLVIQCTCSILR